MQRTEEVSAMATVENVKLRITESPAKPGYSAVAYSYELHPSAADCAAGREFAVSVGLWGADAFDDDVLATNLDEHKVSFDKTAPCKRVRVERAFEVETKLLDEDLFGDDEVFLVVEADAGASAGLAGEHRASGRSNIVTGDF